MDARIIKTKEKIHDSLIVLLRSKNLSDVSVSELCKMANINRNTFYSHYHTPTDVIEEISNGLIDELDVIAKKEKDGASICISICIFIAQRSDIFKVISSPNCDNKYLDIAIKRARDSANKQPSPTYSNENHHPKEYDKEFIIGGCIFVLSHWVNCENSLDPKKMGVKLYDLINSFND